MILKLILILRLNWGCNLIQRNKVKRCLHVPRNTRHRPDSAFEKILLFYNELKAFIPRKCCPFKTKLSYNRFSNRLLSQHVVSKLSLYLPESAFVVVRHTRQAATHQGTTLVRRSILLKFASREEGRLYSFSNLRFGRDLKLRFELLNSFRAKATTLDFGITGNTE